MSSQNVAVPVVIIGAGRSGTNMLRDVLVRLPGFGTWPCDEINYIWRHGNVGWPTDELSPEHATPQVKQYIRKAFATLARKSALSHVVEKTCANTLRVSFVNAVLPEAQFIHIIRDGRDVVASAAKRWQAPLDLPYVLRKARFIPRSDLPYYTAYQVWNRVYRRLSGEKRLAFWGPRFAGMTAALRGHSLEEVCALQWCRCIEKATQELRLLPSARVLWLRYEDFVTQPLREVQTIIDFLGVQVDPMTLPALIADVRSDRTGSAVKELQPEQLTAVAQLMQGTLAQHGYQ